MSGTDLQELLTTAADAARLAGRCVREGFLRARSELDVVHKGAVDLVTITDRTAEEIAIRHLTARYPEHAILAEESGEVQSGTEVLWVLDPLDGTINFAHGHPHFAVSIGCLIGGRPVLGVIFDPARDELFTSIAGGPAHLNGKTVTVSDITQLGQGLLATGFPYDRDQRAHRYVPAVEAFLRSGQGLRRMGAAALDLAWVACGRLDGYWEPGLKPWDVAAGVVIVESAGGRVSDYQGQAFDVLRPHRILASNNKIHNQMVDVLRRVGGG